MVATRTHHEISPFIIQVFLLLVIISWATNLVPSIALAISQLAANPNLSAYYTTFLYSLFLPVVSFLIFMVWRRGKKGLLLVKESLFLTLIVLLVATSISGICRLLLNHFQVTLAGGLGWWYFEVVVCLASAIATFGVLWYARRLGKW